MKTNIDKMMNKKVSRKKFLAILGGSLLSLNFLSKNALAKVFLRDEDSNMYDLKEITKSSYYSLADLKDVDKTNKATDKILQVRSDGKHEYVDISGGERGLSFNINGIGIVPQVGEMGGGVVAYSGKITGWKLVNVDGVASDLVLTIKKNGTEISGTEKPTLSNSVSAEDTNLTTWTTNFNKGDLFTATVDSASIGTKFFLLIYVE